MEHDIERADISALPAILTVNEFAKRLRIGKSHVYDLIQDGAITTITIGRSRRIPRSELARIEAQTSALATA